MNITQVYVIMVKDSCFSVTCHTFTLQAEKMRDQLASLPPLCPPKLPQVSKESSEPPEGLNTGIYRRTDQLLATLLKLSSEVKVVDVTGKTAGGWTVFVSWWCWLLVSERSVLSRSQCQRPAAGADG